MIVSSALLALGCIEWILPRIGVIGATVVDPTTTDKPVNPSECFTECDDSALNVNNESRTEEAENGTTTESDKFFNLTTPQTNSDVQVNLSDQERDLQVDLTDGQKDKLVLEDQVLSDNQVEEEVHFKVQESDFMSVQVCLAIRASNVTFQTLQFSFELC